MLLQLFALVPTVPPSLGGLEIRLKSGLSQWVKLIVIRSIDLVCARSGKAHLARPTGVPAKKPEPRLSQAQVPRQVSQDPISQAQAPRPMGPDFLVPGGLCSEIRLF